MADPTSNPALPPNAGALSEDTLNERRTVRDYYIILRERFWVAFPLALLVSLGFVYLQATKQRLYETRATMQFEKPDIVMAGTPVNQTNYAGSPVDINTFLQVFSSGKLRTRVIDSLSPDEIRVLQRPYLAELKPGDSPPHPSAVLGQVNVYPLQNSLVMAVSVVHRDPEATSLIANRYVEQFMQMTLDTSSNKEEFAVDYLRNRSNELRKEVEQADQALQTYMRKNELVSLNDSTNIVSSRLTQTNSALQAAKLDRITIEGLANQVKDFQDNNRNLLEINAIANYGSIPSLRGQLDQLLRDQAILSERYLERHPQMINIANSIAVARQQLDQALRLSVADIYTNLEKARAQEATLQKEYAKQESDQLRLRDLAVEFNSLQSELNSKRNNYQAVLARLNETLNTRSLENIPVRPLDKATAPGAPFQPNVSKITRLGIILFVAVFLGTAVGLTFIDDRIKSAWDVESFIGVNLLGIIPDLSQLPDDEKYSLVLRTDQNPGTESFLSVYSAVKIHSKLDFPKSILVTSTIPGEGKTLISSNMAGSFARHGKRTLLIDCDLRRPMLHRHFNFENTEGLIPWYETGGNLEGNPLEDPQLGIMQISENLWLLRSGGRSKSPTSLLESKIFAALIEHCKRFFELVVIDSPPLGAVTDSLLIAENTDEVIYVCRFNRAYRKHIRLYVKALRNGKNELLGIVLNGLSPRRIEYYSNYRYYRSYKKYYGSSS